MRQNMTEPLSHEEEEYSLLAKTIAGTSGEGLHHTLPVIVKDGVVDLEPALRDEEVGFGEVVMGDVRSLLGDVDSSL